MFIVCNESHTYCHTRQSRAVSGRTEITLTTTTSDSEGTDPWIVDRVYNTTSAITTGKNRSSSRCLSVRSYQINILWCVVHHVPKKPCLFWSRWFSISGEEEKSASVMVRRQPVRSTSLLLIIPKSLISVWKQTFYQSLSRVVSSR